MAVLHRFYCTLFAVISAHIQIKKGTLIIFLSCECFIALKSEYALGNATFQTKDAEMKPKRLRKVLAT